MALKVGSRIARVGLSELSLSTKASRCRSTATCVGNFSVLRNIDFRLSVCGVLVAVLPSPLIVSPRNPAQTASLKALPCELQGFLSCSVSTAWLVVVDFNPFSSQMFNELSRNLQRLPTFKAGIFRFEPYPPVSSNAPPR